MRRIPLNKLLLFLLFALVTSSLGIHFPTEQEFKKHYNLIKKKDNRPYLYVSKKTTPKTEVELKWNKTILTEITFKQKVSFTDNQLSELSLMFGRGGNWIETPLRGDHKNSLHKAFPGIEQQWILTGFNRETGWMGSGLVYKTYFITFRRRSPIGPPKTKEPLQINADIKDRFKKSGTWLKTKCKGPAKGQLCFSSILNSKISIKVKKDYSAIEVWVKENSSLAEIKNTIRSLTRDKYTEYSRDLSEMSKLEGQNSIMKIATEIPEIFNWTPLQIQGKRIGFIKPATYMKIFKEKKGRWTHIPVFAYFNENCKIEINLDFKGNYHLLATRID